MAAPVSAVDIQQQNFLQRRAVIANALKMKQQIYSKTVTPSSENVLNIPPRPAGLLLGFIVEVTGSVTDGGAGPTDRTIFGNANMVSQFRFDDLSGYTRIQTPGWHLAMLNSARQGFGYGGAYANAIPMGYGDNFPVYQGANPIADAGVQPLRMQYYVPISYSATDLRGSIDMAVTNAVANLQITLNTNPFAAAGDSMGAIYAGHAGDWTDTVTVTVWQVYLDQIPRDPSTGVKILPFLDMNTVYDIKQTTFRGLTANQDFPMPYTNNRSFLSTFVVYNNGNDFNNGSDVTDFSLVSANFTNIWRVPPEILALDARMTFMTDVPLGTYYVESRDMPVNTINYGNMELNIKPSLVNADAYCAVGYESFALVNQLVGATSLAGG